MDKLRRSIAFIAIKFKYIWVTVKILHPSKIKSDTLHMVISKSHSNRYNSYRFNTIKPLPNNRVPLRAALARLPVCTYAPQSTCLCMCLVFICAHQPHTTIFNLNRTFDLWQIVKEWSLYAKDINKYIAIKIIQKPHSLIYLLVYYFVISFVCMIFDLYSFQQYHQASIPFVLNEFIICFVHEKIVIEWGDRRKGSE